MSLLFAMCFRCPFLFLPRAILLNSVDSLITSIRFKFSSQSPSCRNNALAYFRRQGLKVGNASSTDNPKMPACSFYVPSNQGMMLNQNLDVAGSAVENLCRFATRQSVSQDMWFGSFSARLDVHLGQSKSRTCQGSKVFAVRKLHLTVSR
ncbi:hypothetical protein ANRL3_01337 [Anaerolineae bacterium]|nr:hypothetical protein ANRL3_01337 [Anaerolineae bacterium]